MNAKNRPARRLSGGSLAGQSSAANRRAWSSLEPDERERARAWLRAEISRRRQEILTYQGEADRLLFEEVEFLAAGRLRSVPCGSERCATVLGFGQLGAEFCEDCARQLGIESTETESAETGQLTLFGAGEEEAA